MSKLTLKDIDWSVAPVDAEEGYIYDSSTLRGVGFYKGINDKSSVYYYNEYPYKGWIRSSGTPCHEERIQRPSHTFTKSMLVAGKHIVEVRVPYDGIAIYELILSEDDTPMLRGVGSEGGFNYLDIYDENLTVPADSDFDIIKVFAREYPTKVQALKLIWERTPTKVPTQKEVQLTALQDTINKAQEQIESLMKD